MRQGGAMGDFYQVGLVATFHRLNLDGTERLEAELLRHARARPVALVLPALASEFDGPALPKILAELSQVRYLRRLELSLDRADRNQYERARRELERLPFESRVVWHDGPRLAALYEELSASRLPIGDQGKGRSCWMTYGDILAANDCAVIALHDSDITTYDKGFLARLCYPVANPNMGYEFCKGYYPRISGDRLQGRATRLLMTPLVRSMYKLLGYHPLLVYLDSFRYVLAGEFSMVTDLARVNRVPNDWGLEVGTLAEVYRNTSVSRVCQIGLTDRYDHKHQDLSPGDPLKGLMRMSIEIGMSIFRMLAREGIVLSAGSFRALLATYVRTAEDMISRFHDDATINGLTYDRHSEELAVNTFANGIRLAGDRFLADPLGAPPIPNWNRVASAVPDILDRLKAAIDADNA